MRISDWSSDVCSSDLSTASDKVDAIFFCFQKSGWLTGMLNEISRAHPALRWRRAILSEYAIEPATMTRSCLIGSSKRALKRPDKRREGTECVSTCRSRWSLYHLNKKQTKNLITENTNL